MHLSNGIKATQYAHQNKTYRQLHTDKTYLQVDRHTESKMDLCIKCIAIQEEMSRHTHRTTFASILNGGNHGCTGFRCYYIYTWDYSGTSL